MNWYLLLIGGFLLSFAIFCITLFINAYFQVMREAGEKHPQLPEQIPVKGKKRKGVKHEPN